MSEVPLFFPWWTKPLFEGLLCSHDELNQCLVFLFGSLQLMVQGHHIGHVFLIYLTILTTLLQTCSTVWSHNPHNGAPETIVLHNPTININTNISNQHIDIFQTVHTHFHTSTHKTLSRQHIRHFQDITCKLFSSQHMQTSPRQQAHTCMCTHMRTHTFPRQHTCTPPIQHMCMHAHTLPIQHTETSAEAASTFANHCLDKQLTARTWGEDVIQRRTLPGHWCHVIHRRCWSGRGIWGRLTGWGWRPGHS